VGVISPSIFAANSRSIRRRFWRSLNLKGFFRLISRHSTYISRLFVPLFRPAPLAPAQGAHAFTTPSLELRSLPSPGVTWFHQYNELLRLPRAPGLSLTGIRLVIPAHALGSPVLRTLSLCTCRRHYPGAAAGRTTSLIHPAVSAFPERAVGSACASSFSSFARRLLALRPAHLRCHQFVTR
jgi:hypothetical protein